MPDIGRTIDQRRSRLLPVFGFTLAELIVVIAILAILSVIAFISLSQYFASARDTKAMSNVRSVLTAISANASTSDMSPREFIKHDPAYALSGTSVVVFDGIPSLLVAGPFGVAGTNYSAGNPDYAKLRLDSENFKVSIFSRDPLFLPFRVFADELTDTNHVLVGAADLNESSGSKNRSRRFVQTAGILSDSTAFVAGDFPAGMEGSVGGLLKDPEDESGTGALIDGMKTGQPPICSAAEISGYSVPELLSGQDAQVVKNIENGTVSSTAYCSFASVSFSEETVSCSDGFVPVSGEGGISCVQDLCGGSVPENAVSTATSQSLSSNWSHSETPGKCTFECLSGSGVSDPGYSWDGSSCKKDCVTPVVLNENALQYALPEIKVFSHGESVFLTGSHAFGTAPLNGTMSSVFTLSCIDGSASVSSLPMGGSCQPNHTWNSDWAFPSCSADTRIAACGGSVPEHASVNTAPEYLQTWDGLAFEWLPNHAWSVGSETCGYSCDENFVPSGSSCVGANRTVSCEYLPENAEWNSTSSILQTWNGSDWSPTSAGYCSSSSSPTECRFKCAFNHTWNGISCVPDSKTFACSPKPSSGTVWNTVSSYVQNWSGTAWIPADSATTYDASASSAACRYKCDSGYGWDSASGKCMVSVGGSCGTAEDAPSYAYPSSGHCSQGTKADVDTAASDGSFDWTCDGAFGGVSATCSVAKKIDGACGTSNGQTVTSKPTTNLCSIGSATTVLGSGPWNWSCAGVNSGNSASCSTQIAQHAVTWDGNGGSGHSPSSQIVSHGFAVGALPTNPTRSGYAFKGWFTSAGGATAVSASTTVSAAATFYAQWAQNPACGSANAAAVPSAPSANLCSVGTASAVASGTSSFTWTCSNAPAAAASCSAPRQYAVTWDGNGGSGHTPTSKLVSYGSVVGALPTNPTRSGYSFNGWFTATSGGTQVVATTSITTTVTYYAQWTLTFVCGTSVSAGGYTYTTKVGPDGKCWTKNNMKHVPSTGSRWCYSNNAANCTTYGALYNWAAANVVCSDLGTGWALPTDAQWTALLSAGATGWIGNKLSGIISNLPGRYAAGFSLQGTNGFWWSSSGYDSNNAWYVQVDANDENGDVIRSVAVKTYGQSVVCRKN